MFMGENEGDFNARPAWRRGETGKTPNVLEFVIVIVMVAGARIHHETHSNDAADGVYSMANGCPLLLLVGSN